LEEWIGERTSSKKEKEGKHYTFVEGEWVNGHPSRKRRKGREDSEPEIKAKGDMMG